MYASQKNHVNICKLLLANGAEINLQDERYVSALFISVANGHYEISELLIRLGANVDSQDIQNCTPLIIAVKKNEA